MKQPHTTHITDDRVGVVALFQMHLPTLQGVDIVGPGNTPFSHRVRIDGRDYYAISLLKSSDYWYHRLHLTAPEISLVVCMDHDTVLAQSVLELYTGRHYRPLEEPLRKPATRNNHTATQIILGQLLSGDDSAWQRLKTYPESTRYRYLARIKPYGRRRRGKPLAV